MSTAPSSAPSVQEVTFDPGFKAVKFLGEERMFSQGKPVTAWEERTGAGTPEKGRLVGEHRGLSVGRKMPVSILTICTVASWERDKLEGWMARRR